MTLDEAKAIVGNQSVDALRNMIKALNLHPWLNSTDDWRRMEAAKTIIFHRKPK